MISNAHTTSMNASLNKLLIICLVSAGVVTILRFFTQTDLGYDLTIQIQAAQRLIAGEGLTTYAMGQGFLIDKTPATLTHFPAGYSFFTVCLLWLGVPLYLTTKIFGATFTMLGWWGWGLFMKNCLAPAMQRGGLWTAGSFLLAFMLPLFTTPQWDGTDIFLWASAPWVLSWVAAAPLGSSKTGGMLYSLAGFVCGLCCLMRYASVVLVVCIGFIIVLQAIPDWRKVFARGFLFGLSALPSILIQFYILATAVGGEVTPGGIQGVISLNQFVENILEGLRMLPTWNVALLFWLPDSISRHLIGKSDYPFLSFVFVFFLAALPWFLTNSKKQVSFSSNMLDIKFLGALLVVAIPIFLILCMILGSYDYVGDRRYYMPLVPMVLLLLAYLAGARSGNKKADIIIAGGASIYVFGFLVMCIVGMAFFFIPSAHGNVMRSRLMKDSNFSTFPSQGIAFEHSPMRKFVVEYWKKHPDMQILTNFESLFWPDSSLNQARIHRIPECRKISGLALKGPTNILIVAIDRDDGEFYNVGAGFHPPTPCLKQIGNFTQLAIFHEVFYPATKIKVMKTDIPEGVEITF